MKSKEELEGLKKECQELNKKFAELSKEEIKEVTGGTSNIDNIMRLINMPSPITHNAKEQMDGATHLFFCSNCCRDFTTTAEPPYYCPICGSPC